MRRWAIGNHGSIGQNIVIFGQHRYSRPMDGAIVPIVYTAELVDLLEEEGVSSGDVLRRTGIAASQLRNPDGLHPDQDNRKE